MHRTVDVCVWLERETLGEWGEWNYDTGHIVSFGVHDKRNDESVKTQHFGENENQNLSSLSGSHTSMALMRTYHADEKSGLLGSSSDTGVTNDTNCETCSKTCETDGKTCTKIDE